MDELKRCPFALCDGDAELDEDTNAIHCIECGVMTPEFSTPEKAVKFWNTRPEVTD